MVPGVFAADGCGEGTVLVDGVCELAPEESNDGCGEGTVLVDGVCQLDESSGTSIPPLYIAGGAAVIGAAVIGIVFAYSRRGLKNTKDHQSKIWKNTRRNIIAKEKPAKQKPAKQKPAEKERNICVLCSSCGKPLKLDCKVLWSNVAPRVRNHYYREKPNHNYWN